jgi:hypothetical protein
MKHISDPIAGDLGKLDPVIRNEVRRVAGSHTTSTSSKGANRKLPAVDMSRKVLAPAVVPPDPRIVDWPKVAPTSATRSDLRAYWPANRGTYVSGKARPAPPIEMKKTGRA